MLKCKFCGAEVNRITGFHKTIAAKSCWFCNEVEYNLFKEHKTASKEVIDSAKSTHSAIVNLLYLILGEENIPTQVINSEKTAWLALTDEMTILSYLENNQLFLAKSLVKLSHSGPTSKMKYLSAILKNNLPEYSEVLERIRKAESFRKEMEQGMYGPDYVERTNYTTAKRRISFEELESNFEDVNQ